MHLQVQKESQGGRLLAATPDHFCDEFEWIAQQMSSYPSMT
jgi:hypothetical protein